MKTKIKLTFNPEKIRMKTMVKDEKGKPRTVNKTQFSEILGVNKTAYTNWSKRPAMIRLETLEMFMSQLKLKSLDDLFDIETVEEPRG